MAHDYRDTRVLEQYSESIRRIRGIEGQVGSARLQNPEYGYDQVHGALEAKADEYVWPDSQALQPVGELVGSCIQLPIAKGRPVERDGFSVGRPRRLESRSGDSASCLRRTRPTRRPSRRGFRVRSSSVRRGISRTFAPGSAATDRSSVSR